VLASRIQAVRHGCCSTKSVLASRMQAVLHGNGGAGGDLRKFCKQSHPLMLRLFLGDKSNFVTYRADQLTGIKEEVRCLSEL
jgi:hypothetical protein